MEIVERLEAFSGISHKKASLACLLLWRDLGVEISDKENIDIAYDVHIRRIFLARRVLRKRYIERRNGSGAAAEP